MGDIRTVHVQDVEQAFAKNGKSYFKVKVDGKNHACWNEQVAEALKAFIGKQVAVEFEKSGNYENVVGIGGVVGTTTSKPVHNGFDKQATITALALTKTVFENEASFDDVWKCFTDFLTKLNE